jgi:hypothetical protein
MTPMSVAAKSPLAAPAAGRERRRYRRVPVAVSGRLLDTLGREHDCRTADISRGVARTAASALPPIGERVVIYLDGFGRVSGKVARKCGEDEVAIIFDFSAYKREKMAEQLTLAINRGLWEGEPVRPAIRNADQSVKLEFETGETFEGQVADFSLAGISIKSKRPPPLIGVWVRVGNVYGRVARLIEGGFAIDFDQLRRP